MIPGKRGFAFLPALIILASVLIGAGSVLVLRRGVLNTPTENDANVENQTSDNASVGAPYRATLQNAIDNTNDNTSTGGISCRGPKYQRYRRIECVSLS